MDEYYCEKCEQAFKASDEWTDWCDEWRLPMLCPNCIQEECKKEREMYMRLQIHELREKFVLATCVAVAGIFGASTSILIFDRDYDMFIISGLFVYIIGRLYSNKFLKWTYQNKQINMGLCYLSSPYSSEDYDKLPEGFPCEDDE